MSADYVTVDVRDDLARGREPFSRIMTAVEQLQPGQTLRLVAPFEPAPLYGVLAKRGFRHTVHAQPDGSFEVLFVGETPTLPAPNPANPSLELDVRGLEPPEPMVRILEALAVLPRNACLVAHTERPPLHLQATLPERGFVGESHLQADGSCLTTIRHA